MGACARHGVFDRAAKLLAERVRAITGSQGSLHDFEQPKGDPGLFGPASMAWEVHAHFTAMMVGGLASLLVQSLHPRALAAVWDHSDFRHQLKTRLGRTAYFVASTTYGSESMAMAAIRRVNAIHARIQGEDAQGRPYAANEPQLLRWVHLVEVTCFVNAYQHLSMHPLSRDQCDQYIQEMTRMGQLLCTGDLPMTWTSTQEALVGFQDALSFDARAKEIFRLIQHYPVAWVDQPFMQLALNAAFDVMPAWVWPIVHHQPHGELHVQATRWALMAASEPVQWMLRQEGVRAVSERRVRAAASPC